MNLPKIEELLPAEETAKRVDAKKAFESETKIISDALKDAASKKQRSVNFVTVACDEVNDGAVVCPNFGKHIEDIAKAGYTIQRKWRHMICNKYDALAVYTVSW